MEYPVSPVTHGEVLNSILRTDTPATGEAVRRILLKAVRDSLLVMFDIVPDISYRLSPRTFIHPPLTVDKYVYRLSKLIRKKFHETRVLQDNGEDEAYVQTPPMKCPDNSNVTPSFPFIGKVINDVNELKNELEATKLMDVLDPYGQYHARLVKRCEVDSDRFQHIYEYIGTNIVLLRMVLDENNKIWFYKGLRSLMEGFQLLHRHHYVHGDVKPHNITMTPFFQLKLIDFGSAKHVDEYTIEICEYGGWHFINHPVELMMLNDSDISSAELFEGHRKSHLIGRMGEFFRRVSREDDHLFDHWERLRSLSWRARNRQIIYNTDLYGLGASLIETVPKDILEELEPVVYHLITYVSGERRLDLAMRRLDQLIGRLTPETHPDFT